MSSGRPGVSDRPRPRGSDAGLAGPLRRDCWPPVRLAVPPTAGRRPGRDSGRPPTPSVPGPARRLPARSAPPVPLVPPRAERPWLPALPAPLERLPLAGKPSPDGRPLPRGRLVPAPSLSRERLVLVRSLVRGRLVPVRSPVPERVVPVPSVPRGRLVLVRSLAPGRPGEAARLLAAPLPVRLARAALAAPDPGARLEPVGRPLESPPCCPRPFPATAYSQLARTRRGASRRRHVRYTVNALRAATCTAATLSAKMSGGVLLSHAVPRAVPSALKGLTSGFGMGPGVSPSPWPPKLYGDVRPCALSAGRPHLGNRTVDASTPPAQGKTPGTRR
jgi:hypothetical protein